MDANPQTDFQDYSTNSPDSGPRSRLHQFPCAACRDWSANYVHEPGSLLPGCLLKGCYICTDIAKLDDEISSTYQRLSKLFQERQKLLDKPRYMHDAVINCMPAEILSSIFISVQDAIIPDKFTELPDKIHPELPEYKQPSQSPPLLLGAVCKRWRDITLATPQLWTDITIDLDKSVEGQSDMVENWGNRSGALPLDITIFPAKERYRGPDTKNIVSAVRSLAIRWSNVSLCVPASFCHKLLDDLEEIPNINTLFLYELYGFLKKINLQHPLRPRRLLSRKPYLREIPFIWDHLEHINITEGYDDNFDHHDLFDDLVLDIIRHAPNLRHWVGGGGRGDAIPPNFVTNRSLIHFNTYGDMLRHLTLPSLSYLHCDVGTNVHDQRLDTVLDFVDRSCAPLDNFEFVCWAAQNRPFPHLERLCHITSLSLCYCLVPEDFNTFLLTLSQPLPNGILPRLKDVTFHLTGSTPLESSWLGFCELFRKISPPNHTEIEATGIRDPSLVFRRPFSKVKMILKRVMFEDIVDKDILLRLLDAKNSGANLTVVSEAKKEDWFEFMARVHGVEL